MALTTYAELKAYLASDLNRTDLTSPIADFIRLAEAHMSNRLKTREMDVTATLTITDGVATIPTALQSVRSMRLAVTPYGAIQPEGIEALEARRPDVSGTPQFYSMVGEEFVFWPPTSSSAKIRYRRDVPALTDSATSNWILAEHPHLYLYGALFQAYLFLKDDARAGQYEAKFAAAIEEMNGRDIVAQISGMNVSPSVTAV
jgi:hypothetical protein